MAARNASAAQCNGAVRARGRPARRRHDWDRSDVDEPGTRLENVVANRLLRLGDVLNLVHGWNTALHFPRDQEGREVDFAVTFAGKP